MGYKALPAADGTDKHAADMSHRGTPHVFVVGDLVRLRDREDATPRSRAPPKRYRVVGLRTRPPFAASREEICVRACGDTAAIWRDPADLEKIPETLDDLEQAVFEPVNPEAPAWRPKRPHGAGAQCCALQ